VENAEIKTLQIQVISLENELAESTDDYDEIEHKINVQVPTYNRLVEGFHDLPHFYIAV